MVSITAVPDRTLNLPSGARSTVKVQPSHIKRVSDASERLAAAYLPKPFSESDLNTAIERVLEPPSAP